MPRRTSPGGSARTSPARCGCRPRRASRRASSWPRSPPTWPSPTVSARCPRRTTRAFLAPAPRLPAVGRGAEARGHASTRSGSGRWATSPPGTRPGWWSGWATSGRTSRRSPAATTRASWSRTGERRASAPRTPSRRTWPTWPRFEPRLHAQALRVGRRLRRAGLKTRVVQLKLKGNDFTVHTRRRTLEHPTDDGQELYRRGAGAARAGAPPERPLRLTGVSAQELGGAVDRAARPLRRGPAALRGAQPDARRHHRAVRTRGAVAPADVLSLEGDDPLDELRAQGRCLAPRLPERPRRPRVSCERPERTPHPEALAQLAEPRRAAGEPPRVVTPPRVSIR